MVAFLVSPAFPCGAPQQIRGRVLADISGSGSLFIGVYLVMLELRVEDDPEPIAAVLSNPFGVFAFEPVLPCSAYTVTARHRFFSFGAPAQIEPKDFPPNGSGVERDFFGSVELDICITRKSISELQFVR